MDLNSSLHFWQGLCIAVAILDVVALGLLIWTGRKDAHEQRELPTFSPRQLRAAKRAGKAVRG